MNSGKSPKPTLRSEIQAVKQEIDTLRQSVQLLMEEMEYFRHTIEELRREMYTAGPKEPPKRDSVDKLCRAYLDTISTVSIVDKVFVTEFEDTATLWTIVETPPPQDSSEAAQYVEHYNILDILQQNLPVDFHIIQAGDLAGEAGKAIPPEARLLWERQASE